MRILHTSDWHLGRAFNGASMHDEQVAALDRIIEITADSRIDLVIIAGDLYDRGFPPEEAVALFGFAIARLRATGATVVAVSGNHDSGARVGVYDKLLAAGGVSIRGDVGRVDEPVIVEPANGGAPVAVYPIPYLDPAAASGIFRGRQAAVDPEMLESDAAPRRRLSHDQVTNFATGLIRADLARRQMRSVVIAHTFVSGGTPCESEKDLTVGNVERVSIEAFDGFHYVALGHLHGSQEFANRRIAYSGTPLPYSFQEETHTKGVRIVEIAGDGTLTSENVELGVGLKLSTITGTLEDLLTDPKFTDAEPCRVRAVLLDAHMPYQAMAQLQKRFPHAVSLRRISDGAAAAQLEVPTAERTRSPQEFVFDFWRTQQEVEATEEETALLNAALANAQNRVGA